MSRRRKIVWAVVVVALVGGGFGLWAFEPWRLFTSSTIDEPLPVAAVTTSVEAPTAPRPAPAVPPGVGPPMARVSAKSSARGSATTSVPAEPKQLATGAFVTQEHK